jgi:3-oxoacyl-[acyl-carrier protein] reductase
VDLGLEGKAVLITGGSRGIGRATALSLAHEGAELLLCARGQDALEATATEARSLGVKVVTVSADITLPEDRLRVADVAEREFGGVYGFISNASALGALRDLLAGASESSVWDQFYRLDIQSAVHLTDLLSPSMRSKKEGSIIYISSIAGRRALGIAHAYASMKAALIAMGKSFSLDLGRDGVRVNVVAPGTTTFPGAYIVDATTSNPEASSMRLSEIPDGRFSTPEEVGDCITFLLSKKARRIVGHCLIVDGGEYHGI